MRPLPQRRRDGQGFTLIEVLLVVVLIGVLMGVAVVSLNAEDPERRLLRERERLQAQIQYARLMAESDQIEVGIRLHAEGYEFLRFRASDRTWLLIGHDPALKPRKTPGIDLSWRDSNAVARPAAVSAPVSAPAGNNPAGGVRQPDLLLLSSGEATPGVISLSSLDDRRLPPLELSVTDLGDAYASEEADRARP